MVRHKKQKILFQSILDYTSKHLSELLFAALGFWLIFYALSLIPASHEEMKRARLLTPTHSPSPTIDTFGWKTYDAQNNGYSIKYPSDWTLVPFSEGCGPVFYPPQTKKIWLTICGPYINKSDTPQNLAQKEWTNTPDERNNIMLGNHIAIRQELLTPENSNYEIGVFVDKVSTQDSNSTQTKGTLVIHYYIQEKAKLIEAKEWFNQILTTFKFTQ